ncbi:molybdopterin molybdotransferase MoeA [Pedobacter rhizosphaerae]|uniref:Molybdopterin molybdenumtransferase n=1 Tax=Pedobacter rhizosphaerae TaxID=390241 RepID=A0A1H9MR10_9SPHI|nr:gephyrin-like molybdotransferase Glp [Pedobacter rhizosphaerae]SER25929.1 molybdopterin molybdochelatase [Pedobacter rhizosphaerae]
MLSVKEARQLIANQVKLLNPIKIKLEEASGHILAADVFAPYDIPSFRQSAMDGYALIFEDQPLPLQLVGEMAAGTSESLQLSLGQTARIFTGAPVPEGADTVVMQEKVSLSAGKIIVEDIRLEKGSNVRAVGSEIKSGALAMAHGSLLSPAAIGFLAGIGITAVTVFPMPKVVIIVTGKELQKPGSELTFGQIYESNSYSLSAALKSEGITEISIVQADDDLEILTRILESALLKNDVILLTGGVSVGDYDFVLAASKACNIQQIFHKVKQKPGKPLFFGTKGEQLIFGLPGNPSSVLSCYYNYVLPAIKKLSNKENSVQEIKATLTHDYQKPAGLTHFLKGNYRNGKATPLNAQESFRLSSFAQANCLICLDEMQQEFKAGQTVDILLLPH